METLYNKHRILISQASFDIVREVMHTISWDRQLVAIRGSRGVGKTTLMRQYIKQRYGVNAGEALYCVMDSIYFTNHSLLDLAERFHTMGGKHLFLDEVHKYPTWSKEVKEIIDLWPDMKVTFTGSSLIQILNADADLSRRVLSYTMPGLSFREYLHFYKHIHLPVHTLQELLSDADDICDEVCRVCHPQPLFEEYLRVGYYPFYDGEEIVNNVRAGGFILGDEASGGVLGKKLMADFIKGLLPKEIEEEFVKRYDLDYMKIVQKVYREPLPSKWLASFSPFISEFRDNPHINNLIRTSFDEFFKRNIVHYDYKNYPVNLVGSIAHYYEDILKDVAAQNGATIGKIIKSPIDGLVEYHTNAI